MSKPRPRGSPGASSSPRASPERYIHFTPDLITDEGEVTVASTEVFLRSFMSEFHDFIGRVYTAYPRS